MDILYLSSMYSDEVYNQIFNHFGKISSYASQKYNRMMVKGLIKNGATIYALTQIILPNKSNEFSLNNSRNIDDNGITYKYINNQNTVSKIVLSCVEILKWCNKHKDGIVVCDIILGELSMAVNLVRPFIRNKLFAIVTDVPVKRSHKPKNIFRKFSSQLKNILISGFDGYIFLTENMNSLLNKKNKPYVVIEGFVDYDLKYKQNSLEQKYSKKVCMFAGLLDKVYGIETLVKAFIKADTKDAELHIYGHGDYTEELADIANKHTNVKYLGERVNSEIIKEEMKATLLINPRPSNDEYTKYSFPSKNLEYISSGTPLLTAKLPGMPKEYQDYVFIFENETEDGLCNKIKELLNMSIEDLYYFGNKAKQWSFENKNNYFQTKKIIEMIENTIN